MKSMKKTLGALSGRFAATLGVLATALVLTACGGGGGGAATGGGVTTPPVATPTINLTLGSIALDGKKDVPTSASTTVTVNLAPSNFASSVTTGYTLTGTTTINCNGVQVQSLTTGSTAAADAKTATISVSFTGAPNATTCTGAGTVNATRGGVTSNSLPFTMTFTSEAALVCPGTSRLNSTGVCIAPPGAVQDYTWNDVMKAWVANIGVLVTGANTLPDNCFLVGDACWKENVANGKIKFVNSGVTMTGQNTRPIVFAYYIVGGFSNGNPSAGYSNVMPMYADVVATSPFVNQGTDNASAYFAVPTIKGSTAGAKVTVTGLTPGTTPTGTGCYERVWFASGAFAFAATTCPI